MSSESGTALMAKQGRRMVAMHSNRTNNQPRRPEKNARFGHRFIVQRHRVECAVPRESNEPRAIVRRVLDAFDDWARRHRTMIP